MLRLPRAKKRQAGVKTPPKGMGGPVADDEQSIYVVPLDAVEDLLDNVRV